MKNAVALPWVFLALASLITAGCGSKYNAIAANNYATPTPLPIPTATCTPPPGYTIQMVFPQSNAPNAPVAANLQGVVFAIGPSPQPGTGSPSPLPTNWYVYATSPTFGTPLNPSSTFNTTSVNFLATPIPAPGSVAGSTPTPLPVPSDSPLPGFTNFIYETTSIGIFANLSQWTIYLANSNCYPGLMENTFTTTLTDTPTPTPSPAST